MAQMDGTACVILQVSKQSGANEASTAQAVDARMAELAEENPGIRYAAPYLASDYINLVVESALQNIVLGVVLAAVVVFLFLRRWGRHHDDRGLHAGVHSRGVRPDERV